MQLIVINLYRETQFKILKTLNFKKIQNKQQGLFLIKEKNFDLTKVVLAEG